MSVSAPTSGEKTVDLKNPFLAGALALLLPGLGHFYQGRNFKAAIYCVCILGLFFSGQALGEWKVVYLGDSDSGGRFAAGHGIMKRLLQGYAAQFPVGVFAWPAMIQSGRYHGPAEDGRPHLAEPLESDFRGSVWINGPNGPEPIAELMGTVQLAPPGSTVANRFVGQTKDGTPVEFELGAITELGKRISAAEERTLETQIASLPAGINVPADARPYLRGAIPRPFLDRYQVPLGDQGEDVLTAKLGGRLEIAYVFTWIAGLLNVLAIWDAFDGPAYGYGSELEEQLRRRRRKQSDAPEPSNEPAPRPQPAVQSR